MQEQARTVARVLAVLEQLSSSRRPLTNVELARRIRVPVASMHRLLQKLLQLDFIQLDGESPAYSVSPKLALLGERLGDAACTALPLRQMLADLREQTGYNTMIWVPSGTQVRLAALQIGKARMRMKLRFGQLSDPFSTPGLAIAMTYADTAVRTLARQCRRRNQTLGRSFNTVSEVLQSLARYRALGHVSGYNLASDGWALLAWPLPISQDPVRIGALAIGAPAPTLRRTEGRLIEVVEPRIAAYLRQRSLSPATYSRR